MNAEGQTSFCEILDPCGNGVYEPELGETCDDGNNNNNDGCMGCVKSPNSQCFVIPETGGSLCNFPFYCRYTYYSVRYIPLTEKAKQAFIGTPFQGTQTVKDIVEIIVFFDEVTSYVRWIFYNELEKIMKRNDLWLEWGIVTLEIHKCTGNIDYRMP